MSMINKVTEGVANTASYVAETAIKVVEKYDEGAASRPVKFGQ